MSTLCLTAFVKMTLHLLDFRVKHFFDWTEYFCDLISKTACDNFPVLLIFEVSMTGQQFRDKVLDLLRNRSRLLSAEDVAKLVGVSPSTIKAFQNGRIKAPSGILMVDLYNLFSDKKLKF